jgi:DNA invertase Pin-like site-specific DNA recombinase
VDAHLERLKIKERTKRAMDYRRKNKMATSHEPFGFKRSSSNSKQLMHDDQEMAVVNIILGQRRSGMGYADIAQQLNMKSVPTKKGSGKWYGKVVKGIIEFHSAAL